MALRPILRPMTASDRLVTDLPTNALVRHVLVWQALGLMLMACHVLLLRESIWLLPLVPSIVGWLYLKAPLAGALVFFQILIYQNLIISVFSPGMDYMPTFVVLEGTNFAVLGAIAVIGLSRLMAPYWWRRSSGLLWLVLAALAMTVLYSLLGASKAGPTSAMVYFRNFTSPLLAVLVGLDLGRTWSFRTVATAFISSVVLAIGLGLIEYFDPLDYYAWVNEVTFYQLRYTAEPQDFYVPADIVRHFTAAFMNISGGSTNDWSLTSFRIGSSIITPTSFAYLLSVVSLAAVSLRRGSWLLVTVPMMFLLGVKGALLLLIISLILWWIWELTCSKPMLIVSGILLSIGYVTFGITSGLDNNDYHVVGFLGGVHGFMSNPLGHGLGVGGNLSATAKAGFKMDGPGGFTHMGADFALESAVGVLLYQTGIASLLVFAVFIAVLSAGPLGELRGNQLRPLRQDIMYFAVATIMVNGVYQEEAYSPYAAGIIMLLCSCAIANGRRPHVVYKSVVRRFAYKDTFARPGEIAAMTPGMSGRMAGRHATSV